MGWPFTYAEAETAETPRGPTIRIQAPRWQRVANTLSLGVITLFVVITAVTASHRGDSAGLAFVAVGAVGASGIWILNKAFLLDPYVAAGPSGIEGRGAVGSTVTPWNRVDLVWWNHRFGAGMYTRTEISVRRPGSSDLARVAVLHYLRGSWYGARQSRDMARPFLEVCRHYGASTRFRDEAVVPPSIPRPVGR
jgi:hypothetical protein